MSFLFLFLQLKIYLFLLLSGGYIATATTIRPNTFFRAHYASLQLFKLIKPLKEKIPDEIQSNEKNFQAVNNKIAGIIYKEKERYYHPDGAKDKNASEMNRLTQYLKASKSMTEGANSRLETYITKINGISESIYLYTLRKEFPEYYRPKINLDFKPEIANWEQGERTLTTSTGFSDRLSFARKVTEVVKDMESKNLAGTEQSILKDLEKQTPGSIINALEGCLCHLEGPFDCNWEVKIKKERVEDQASSPLGVGEKSCPFESSLSDNPFYL